MYYTFRILCTVLIMGCFVTLSHAQSSWPSVHTVTKPWTRWWWQGSAVNKTDLKATMRLYQKAGLGGLEITPIYGVKGYESQFIDFLSPQWIEMLETVLTEAKTLGLGIDMATGTGWPFGGPWVTDQDASKYFTYKKYTVEGGHRMNDSIYYNQVGFVRTANGVRLKPEDVMKNMKTHVGLQALAIDQVQFDESLPLFLLMAYDQDGHALDLTTKVIDQVLDWTAPPGSWTLYAVFYGLHGKMVERAAPGGEGLVIDHFDVNALKHYLTKFDTAFKNKSLSGLRGFFNDSYEVDDARGQSNWTPLFFDEFNKRRGYNLKNELPALLNTIHTDHSARVLYDYRQTISELLLEKFTLPWIQWGHSKNKLIRNQSHGSPANILDLYAAVDIPESEGNELNRFKFASSAAHVMGKQLASAEAATWLNEHFLSSLSDVRNCVDLFFLGGINHIFYHGTNYSPLNEAWPGWLFYAATHLTPANPIWKDFKTLNNYVARCQSFLQAGKPDHELLVYFPFADRIHQQDNELLYHFDGMHGFENSIFKATADSLSSWGYEYDFISDRQIQTLSYKNGRIQSPGGSYRALLISGGDYMPLNTLFKLDSLQHKGADVLFNTVPSKVPGFHLYQNRQVQFDSLLNSLKMNTRLPLNQLLNTASVDHEGALYKAGLQCIKRITTDGKYYFIKNSKTYKIEEWIPIHSNKHKVIRYDPLDGRYGLIPVRLTSRGIEIYFSLDPNESVILEATDRIANIPTYTNYDLLNDQSIHLNHGWSLKFVQGGPEIPGTFSIDTLSNWLDLSIAGISAYSGTAAYSNTFDKPKTNNTHYVLDLGKVEESAEIRLNDKTIATCIGPTFKVIIPSNALKLKNKLEILVTNSMANRIIDLEQRKVPWKKFYNINFPPRLSENKGDDGLFTAIHWKPKTSGLIGPVNLTALRVKK
ncbi:MAG: glycosyl hydrolase [Saprospiraceae bacterium]